VGSNTRTHPPVVQWSGRWSDTQETVVRFHPGGPCALHTSMLADPEEDEGPGCDPGVNGFESRQSTQFLRSRCSRQHIWLPPRRCGFEPRRALQTFSLLITRATGWGASASSFSRGLTLKLRDGCEWPATGLQPQTSGFDSHPSLQRQHAPVVQSEGLRSSKSRGDGSSPSRGSITALRLVCKVSS
jgi:hypothetical protein